MDTLLSNVYLYIKSNLIKIILCFIILVLTFFLFKSCENPLPVSKSDKALIEKLKKDSQKYEDIARVYKDSVKILKEKKVIIKKEIEQSIVTTKEKLKPVSSLKVKGIANYFQSSYKMPVVITQYGVALSDTLAKEVIKDLIKGQGFEEQLELTQKLLTTEEKENTIKDNIIINLDKAIIKKDSLNSIQEIIITNAEQSIKSEKNKKTFWQVATGVAGGIITYLVITK